MTGAPTSPARRAGTPAPDLPRASPAGLARAVRIVASLTLLSRFAGLIRDLITVRIFENTPIGSAFAAAFAIPNLFRRLLGEGALSAAFLPEYATLRRDRPELAGRFASLTIALLALLTAGATLALEAVLALVLRLAPADADRAFSIQLIMVMLPYMPLVCTAAILGGMLQVHDRFAAPAAGPILLNVLVIAAAAWYFTLPDAQKDPARTAFWIAGAAVASGLVQVALSLYLLRRHVQWTRVVGGAGESARRMLRRFGPVVIGMGTLQLNALIDTVIAMWPIWVGATVAGVAYPLDGQSNAILSYTQRLYQFPLGVFGIAVATAVFPMLSRVDGPLFTETLRRGLRLSLFIGLPASVGLLLVREDLTRVVFSGGGRGFDGAGVARSAAVLLGYAPAVWAYSLNHVLTRAFFARGETRTPMKVALAMVALNLALNLALIWPLGEAGLAWATSITAMLQFVILHRLLARLIGGPIAEGPTRGAAARIVGATLLMALAVAAFLILWPAAETWAGAALRLGLACGAGLAAYAALARALGVSELGLLLSGRRGEGDA